MPVQVEHVLAHQVEDPPVDGWHDPHLRLSRLLLHEHVEELSPAFVRDDASLCVPVDKVVYLAEEEELVGHEAVDRERDDVLHRDCDRGGRVRPLPFPRQRLVAEEDPVSHLPERLDPPRFSVQVVEGRMQSFQKDWLVL